MNSGDFWPRRAFLKKPGTVTVSVGPLIQTTGRSPDAVATGPMARVITGSLQHLDPMDLQAMAQYLQSLPDGKRAAAVSGKRPAPMRADPDERVVGELLYGRHCADCHGRQGEGVTGRGIALAGNRTITLTSPDNAARAVLHGGFAPDTRLSPLPPGMPPFAPQLSDREVGAVLTFVRSAWGHRAPGVEARTVNALRAVPVD